MAIAGNYTPENWINGATSLDAVTLTKVTDAIKALDDLQRNTLDVNFFNDRDYYLTKNSKHIIYFNNSAGWTALASTTKSDDSTYGIIDDKGLKILENDNTSSYVGAYMTVSNIDLTKFNDEFSASSTSDRIVLGMWVYNKADIDYLRIKLGTSNSVHFYYDIDIDSNSSIVNGYNVLSIAKSAFNSAGGFSNWATITYIHLEYVTYANKINTYITFTYWHMARVDPSDSAYYNVFQKYNGTAWVNSFYPSNDHWCLSRNSVGISNPPAIWTLNPQTVFSRFRLKTQVRNCFSKFIFVCKRDGEIPNVTQYYDSNNYITGYVSTGTMYLTRKVAGVTTTVSTTITLAKNNIIKVIFEKTDAFTRYSVKKNGSTAVFLEIESSGLNQFGSIYIGNASVNNHCCLVDFQISNSNIFTLGQGEDTTY